MRVVALASACACVTLLVAGTPAASADLQPIVKAPIAPPAYNWTGFYIGANLGVARGSSDIDPNIGIPFPVFTNLAGNLITPAQLGVFPGTSASDTSVIGGGQVGFNWQRDRWVWGVEADISGTGLKALSSSGVSRTTISGTQTVTANYSAEVDWIATLRARAGFTWNDRTLIYATAGLATASARLRTAYAEVQPAPAPAPLAASDTEQMFGWTVGIGAEWAWSRDLTFGAEYRHVDLGGHGFNTGIVDANLIGFVGSNSGSMHYTVDQVTARVNWRPWQ
jgi:outer membrane immunogenic protein